MIKCYVVDWEVVLYKEVVSDIGFVGLYGVFVGDVGRYGVFFSLLDLNFFV